MFFFCNAHSIFVLESERGSKLDPLPEEKSNAGVLSPSESTSAAGYKRVYPEWKPSATLENMDVAGTMEAIEDVQTEAALRNNNAASAKDKSAWRKSNLNVSNSQEDVETANNVRYRRQKSRESANSTLHAILEEDKRKNIIAQLGDRFPTDKLSLYIRKPVQEDTTDHKPTASLLPVATTSKSSSPTDNKQSIYIRSTTSQDSNIASPPAEKHSIYIRPDNDSIVSSIQTSSPEETSPPPPHVPIRRQRNRPQALTPDGQTSNKIEIDSDNIETPPSTRRSYNIEKKPAPSPCKKLIPARPLHKATVIDGKKEMVHPERLAGEQDPLGDGQFDRHSSARRTRRFKRPTDQSSGTEEKSPTSSDTISPPGDNSPSVSMDMMIAPMTAATAAKQTAKQMATARTAAEEERLKKWKDSGENEKPKNQTNTSSKVVERIGKIGRSMSRISQEDVREAIRSLKSPTPDRSWSPPRENVRETTAAKLKTITTELNDEGFEETQSLVSDTPSHGKDSNSSCADQQQSTGDGSNKRTKPKRLISSDSAITTGSEASKKKTFSAKTAAHLQTVLNNKNQQLLERSKSVRVSSTSGTTNLGTGPPTRNLLPKRTNSLRQRPNSLQASPTHISSISANNSPSRRNLLNTPANDVERSSSRTSLRSSRSSINSAASCATVKKMPLKTTTIAATVATTTTLTLNNNNNRKTPFYMQNNAAPNNNNSGNKHISHGVVPASRSSSSGSSIAATTTTTLRKPPSSRSTSTVNTSFKENQQSSPTKNRLLSTTTSKSVPSNLSSTVKGSTISSSSSSNNNNNNSTATSRSGGFMRPTAASATKIKGK
jgi:inverted formin-2